MNALARLALLAIYSLMPSAQASELGRLFFTPDERSQLEYAHKAQQNENGSAEQSSITVNGVIQRSDGSRIVWINGKAQKTASDREPDKASVAVPGKSQPVKIKVGQRFVPDSTVAAKTAAQNASMKELP